MVQVAVPERAPDDPVAALLALLAGAIGEAERWAQRRGMAAELLALREVARRA
jgi:hypothetical protein